jgi:hypothetical protein
MSSSKSDDRSLIQFNLNALYCSHDDIFESFKILKIPLHVLISNVSPKLEVHMCNVLFAIFIPKLLSAGDMALPALKIIGRTYMHLSFVFSLSQSTTKITHVLTLLR